MSAENHIEKAVNVLVPAELFNELFSRGKEDVITKYTIKSHTEEIVGLLTKAGFLDVEEAVTIAFTPTEELGRNSLTRTIQCMKFYKNAQGMVLHADASWHKIDVVLIRNN